MTDPFIYISGFLAGTSIAAWVGWHRALSQRDIARDDAAYGRWAHGYVDRALKVALSKKIDLENRLRKIEQARHLSAKHARAAQIAQRAAKVAATANELRREAAVKRLAA